MSNPNRIIRSLKIGDDADARRLIANAGGTTAINGNPGATELGLNLQHCEMLHLYPQVTGGAVSYVMRLWYRNSINGLWHPAAGTITITDNTISQVETNGEQFVYFEITAENNVTDTINFWAGYNTPSAS